MIPDALSYLRELARFSELEERELSLLSSMSTVHSFPTGEIIVERSKKSMGLLLLVQGQVVAIQRVGVAGVARHYELSSPSFIGPTRLGASTDGYFDFAAQSDCVVLVISRDDFQSVERANAVISRALVCSVYTEIGHAVGVAEDYLMRLYHEPGQTKKRLQELSLAV